MVVIVDEGSLKVLGSLKEKNMFQVFPIILRRNKKIVCDKKSVKIPAEFLMFTTTIIGMIIAFSIFFSSFSYVYRQ